MSNPAKGTAPFGAWERELAFRYIGAKRENGGVAMISIISFVGILLAVAILIVVMSVMNGFRTELLNRILGVNGHVYVDARAMTPPQVGAFLVKAKAVDGVNSVMASVQGQVLVVGHQGADARGGIVQGIAPQDLNAMDIIAKNIVAGNLLNYGKGEFGGDEIAIGSQLASNLGVLPGDYVDLISPNGASTPFGTAPRSKEYKIGAVFDVGMSEYDEILIYMPVAQAQLFFGRESSYDMIEARLDNPENSDAIITEFAKFAGGAYLSDWREKSEGLVSALGIERVVMRLILSLLIVIATLNIISGLVMLVKNKGRDIAILRTIGVSRAAITRIFVMIGASIGVCGTAFGVLIGALFCVNITTIQKIIEKIFGPVFPSEVYFLSQIPAHVEWSEVYITATFALIMSVLVTLPPAMRAAKLDPVEALRYE